MSWVGCDELGGLIAYLVKSGVPAVTVGMVACNVYNKLSGTREAMPSRLPAVISKATKTTHQPMLQNTNPTRPLIRTCHTVLNILLTIKMVGL
jgi:hypothetical protein